MAKRFLVLIDWQNEWTNPASPWYVGEIGDTIGRLNRLIDNCRRQKYKVIFTRHIEAGSDAEFAPDSESIEIIKDIKKKENDLVIDKYKISPFYETDLDKKLKRADKVVVAGILTNLCVREFIAGAYDRELDITVIKDCCVSLDRDTQEFTFQDLAATRPEIEFLDLAEFIEGKK